MILLGLIAAAMQLPQPMPRSDRPLADSSIFRPLELPTPTRIRTGSGAPGPDYWQQKVDYSIAVTLDPAEQRLSGSETVTYHNRSPDTLRYLWFQLDQNICPPDARGAFVYLSRTRNRCWDGPSLGYMLGAVSALRAPPAARSRPAGPDRPSPLATTLVGTMMRVDLDQALTPGGVLRVSVAFSFAVPEHGSDRMGRARYGNEWAYELAQWYPRLAVYDDVRGWNTEQYLGGGEFYLEYGDFDYAVTLPRGFLVVGTGVLQNPGEVLTPEQSRRLDAALRSDTTIAVVAAGEAGAAAGRAAGEPTLTWRFRAQNVRDVAWAAARNFRWDASGWNGILMQSFYPPEADPIWRRSTELVRFTIRHYSQKWFPYPYPTAINVAGPVSGMEYPMIVFCDAHDRMGDNVGTWVHELGHQWFPMIVGSNERLYPWMDEGFNTFINIPAQRALAGRGRPAPVFDQPAAIASFMRTGLDRPMMTPSDRLGSLLGEVEYRKPSAGLYILRHGIVEDSSRFDFAFREYIRRWAFKHPTPADFFRTMNDALGEDLSWFWRGWFFRTDRVDVAVDSVVPSDTGATMIVLSSPGTLPMPADVRITYADSGTETIRLPVEAWYMGSRFVWVRRFPKVVARVDLDPDQWLPDVNRANNGWPRPAPRTSP